MGEVGCLKDGCFQNLQVEGNMTALTNIEVTAGLIFGRQSVTAAGADQAGAGAISATGGTVVDVTGADNTKGVVLPSLSTAKLGQVYLICNNAAANTLEVYPASGDQINPAADDAPITIAADTIILLIALDSTQWFGAELPVVGA